MTKLITSALLATTLIGVSTFAIAQPVPFNTPNQTVKKHHKNLHLTVDQAKTLVTAALIKHGQTKNSINSPQVITLKDNHKFYLFTLNNDGKPAKKFFIVDGTSGKIMNFPNKRHAKRGMRMMSMMNQNGMMPPPPPAYK